MLKNVNISSELFLKDMVSYLRCVQTDWRNAHLPRYENLFAHTFAVMRLHLLRCSDSMLKYLYNNLHTIIVFFWWGGGGVITILTDFVLILRLVNVQFNRNVYLIVVITENSAWMRCKISKECVKKESILM